MKAKFRCNSITDFGTHKQVNFSAVHSAQGENVDFAKATPYGELKMNIDSDAPASNFFIPANDYYLVFEEVEK